MANVAEHHPKEERERHDCKEGWTDFLVVWNAIGFNEVLERFNELICSEERGRSEIVMFKVLELQLRELKFVLLD